MSDTTTTANASTRRTGERNNFSERSHVSISATTRNASPAAPNTRRRMRPKRRRDGGPGSRRAGSVGALRSSPCRASELIDEMVPPERRVAEMHDQLREESDRQELYADEH